MNKFIISATIIIVLGSCRQNNSTDDNTSGVQYIADTIIVSENSPILGHIVIQKAHIKDFTSEFHTVGTVRPVSGKLAEIASPFAGRVISSFVRLGQRVDAGSPVFELGSSDFFEATKSYFAAKSSNELAQKNYNRQKELALNGIGAQRDLEEAENEANIANQEFEQAKATLRIFNINTTSLEMGQPLKVLSPISGEVVKYDMTIGSYIREDSEPPVIVADLSRVWVAALVKEKYFGSIRHGDRVEVFTDAHPDKTIWGTIYHIGEILDEQTRSLEVIVDCDNTDRDLKLGMFCEVHFLSAPEKAIILPSTAIMQEQDNDYVLLELSNGRFIRRKVETQTVNTESVRIVSGIDEDDNVVVSGGIYLNM